MPLRSRASPFLSILHHHRHQHPNHLTPPRPPLHDHTTQRPFHASPRNHDTHYQTLGLPPTASPAEIKKAFYALSKTHHPDLNRNDPLASERFVKISDAYHVLGVPEKRQRYDREHGLGAHAASSSNAGGHARPQCSYSSSGPAGGRPASGLSRRRTHFRGPPPSFYRSGGWGEQGAKRSKGAEEAEASARAQTETRSAEGGMGPGQSPFGNASDVPHFDREGHYRTQTRTENRRRKRMYDGDDDNFGQVRGVLTQFLFVGGIISIGVFVPSYLFERFTKKPRGEGS